VRKGVDERSIRTSMYSFGPLLGSILGSGSQAWSIGTQWTKERSGPAYHMNFLAQDRKPHRFVHYDRSVEPDGANL
jgi:hypothetical protein